MEISNKGIKVLIVEDSPLVSECFKAVLEITEPLVEAVIAQGLDRAWGIIPEFKPDVILLDLHLPGSEAVATVAHVPMMEEVAAVVVITGDNEFPPEAITSMGADFVFKNVVMAHWPLLTEIVRTAFNRQKMKKDHKAALDGLREVRELLEKGDKPNAAATD